MCIYSLEQRIVGQINVRPIQQEHAAKPLAGLHRGGFRVTYVVLPQDDVAVAHAPTLSTVLLNSLAETRDHDVLK